MVASQEIKHSIPAYELVADQLVKAGVECIFGVLGEDIASVVNAAVARGIVYYPARHENHAVSMADGYARATGRIGVAAVTGGPGFTNALTAIYTSHLASSPILVLTGAGRAEEDDRDPDVVKLATGPTWLKHFPQASVLKEIGIETVKPLTPEAASRDAAEALALARGRPVVLVLGIWLLLQKVATSKEQIPVVTGKEPSPLPDPAKIAEVADFLQETWAVKQPLVIAGRGAMLSGAGPTLQKLASQIGALLATSLPARGLFGDDPFSVGVCGSYSTSVATDLITQADCVLAFGAGLNPWTTYRNSLFPKALIIQVDSDPSAIGRFLPAAIGVEGDVKAVAEALVSELERRGHKSDGYRNSRTQDAIVSFRKDAEIVDRSTPTLVDPRTMMLALDRMLPIGRILCVDSGQQARFAIRYISTTRPQNLIQAADFGSIGLGFGTAIGAQIGRPGELVVCPVGDGAAMMSLGDLESIVRLRLPILVVVSNDESYGAEVNALTNLGLDTTLANTPCPSFEAMAIAMGARAATVRTIDDLEVIEAWLGDNGGVPLVLDCRVNPAVRAE
ncbi:sulfoacetaldehyde acetyltransferase [Caballeronia calidae]|uniref:Sulfoacetaldehyde acetyltransferase n=1 Tax=Caballeronia calidae TaxID=1777139 RepID=A0A158EFT9_9BURK|nr:thiamine pyrophosphate-binding protein [Caballeronia calidae]SAL04767.1 sulfoacetaldehyde acetyltransferase [Caballeronia calidae]